MFIQILNVYASCINFAHLFEATIEGDFFTWRGGLNFYIHIKLDRAFINFEFADKFPNYRAMALNHSSSDHCPVHAMLKAFVDLKKNIPFKFSNT